jgi:hypothetical protein
MGYGSEVLKTRGRGIVWQDFYFYQTTRNAGLQETFCAVSPNLSVTNWVTIKYLVLSPRQLDKIILPGNYIRV